MTSYIQALTQPGSLALQKVALKLFPVGKNLNLAGFKVLHLKARTARLVDYPNHKAAGEQASRHVPSLEEGHYTSITRMA
jgi:hypothetical protein